MTFRHLHYSSILFSIEIDYVFVFIKYFISGSAAVAVHFAVLIAAVELLSTPPLLGSFAGFVAGSLINYSLQYSWTFQSKQNHKQAFSRYAVVTLSMLLLNLLIFKGSTDLLAIDYRLGQLLATIVVFLANYTVNSRYTFR